MKIKSICVVGVDGTGKSSIVESLRKTIGDDKTIVQYMGSRQWESPLAIKYLTNGRKGGGVVKNLMTIVAFIYEMYYRVLKHRKESRLVIFDRYVDEKILSFKNKKGGLSHKVILFLYLFFLKWFFHKPRFSFYLTCPLEVSFERKTDIETEYEKQKLKITKEFLDVYYGEKEKTRVIDTSLLSQEETLRIIMETLREYNLLS